MATQNSNPDAPNYVAPGEQLTALQKATNVAILKRNLAIGLLVTCPILIALPPRKLDVYTFCLAGTTFISLNHLQKHTTGRSFLNRLGINDEGTISERIKEGANAGAGGGLPTERARLYRQMLKEKKEAEMAGRTWTPPKSMDDVKSSEEKEKEKGVITGLLMGNAPDDWKERRDRKEREALERGDGIGTLIQDYFQEAMGYKKDDEDEEDEKK